MTPEQKRVFDIFCKAYGIHSDKRGLTYTNIRRIFSREQRMVFNTLYGNMIRSLKYGNQYYCRPSTVAEIAKYRIKSV